MASLRSSSWSLLPVLLLACDRTDTAPTPFGASASVTASVSSASASGAASPAASASASPPSPSAAAPSAAENAPTVRLLDPGRPPHRVLTLGLELGDTARLEVDSQVRYEVDESNGQFPATKRASAPAHYSLGATVTRVEPGQITVALELMDVGVLAQGELTPEMAEQAGKDVSGASGTRASIALTALGSVLGVHLTKLEKPTAPLREAIDNLTKALRRIMPELPSEAVGVGARWQTVNHRNDQGVRYDETSVYTLSALNGEEASVSVAIAIEGPGQYIEEHGIQVLSLIGSGNAKGRYELGKLGPLALDVGQRVTSVSVLRQRKIKMVNDHAFQLKRQ